MYYNIVYYLYNNSTIVCNCAYHYRISHYSGQLILCWTHQELGGANALPDYIVENSGGGGFRSIELQAKQYQINFSDCFVHDIIFYSILIDMLYS